MFNAGIKANPTGPWTTQAARSLFLRHGEQLVGACALVRDRGSHFVDSFDGIFRTKGFKILKTPVRTPVANTFAERWIGSIRRELLDRTIIWKRRQLEPLAGDPIAHSASTDPTAHSASTHPRLNRYHWRPSHRCARPDATASSTNTETPHNQARHSLRAPHDPETYDPDRWAAPIRAELNDAHMPFSIGRRDCLGQLLAHIGWTTKIPRLVIDHDYRIATEPNYEFGF